MPPGTKKYLILNGHYYETSKALLTSENRAFRYGDGLFETIRCHKTKPLFFEQHYDRLLRGMSVLKMTVASIPSGNSFREYIERLIVRNRIFTDARIRISVYRRDGGLYTPTTNSASWLLEALPLENKGFHLNEEGLKIGVFDEFPKAWSLTSPFKTLAATPYILAGLHKSQQQLDDCLILNQHQKIIESISSNLFWIKDNKLYTPAISSGCIEGIMRHQIINFAKLKNIPVIERPGTTKAELISAEEIFLTNSINGIRWVVAFEDKRYYNRMPKDITRWLNETSMTESFS
jgi:branched-subunit amino acid aminotransferase/4-amino-4-deoxychorismate lyase